MKDIFKNIKKAISKEKALLFFDIETSPLTAYLWRIGYEISVQHSQIIEDSKIITIQYMFEGDKKVSYLSWDKKHDDRKMLIEFVKIYNKSKIAVAQNGDKFDLRVLQWRLNVLRLPPLTKIVTFDTLKLSRTSFAAPSNKLDYRSKAYGLGGKIRMDFEDWIDVMKDKPGALNKMIKYGCKDILDMRAIFWRELPYYNNLPASLAVLVGLNRDFCPHCAKIKKPKFNVYPTKVGMKKIFECGNCGHQWRDSRNLKLEDVWNS